MTRWTGTRLIGAALAATAAALLTGAGPATAARHDDRDAPRYKHWRSEAGAVSMTDVGRITGADGLWRHGLDGSGVGVALVDTGVVPVAGLRGTDVVDG